MDFIHCVCVATSWRYMALQICHQFSFFSSYILLFNLWLLFIIGLYDAFVVATFRVSILKRLN